VVEYPGADAVTLSEPDVIVWLLVVEVVKTAAAPAPIRARAATQRPPSIAIVRSFI
jgi:hypothetical protein